MTLEECLEEDGNYENYDCNFYMYDFEAIVKDGKVKLTQVQLSPYKIESVDEKDFNLICDLYECNNWIVDNKKGNR